MDSKISSLKDTTYNAIIEENISKDYLLYYLNIIKSVKDLEEKEDIKILDYYRGAILEFEIKKYDNIINIDCYTNLENKGVYHFSISIPYESPSDYVLKKIKELYKDIDNYIDVYSNIDMSYINRFYKI